MNKNTHLANAVIASDGKAKYDDKVKEILSDKQILSWILRDSVEEFKGMTIDRIIPCIEGEPEVSTVPVYPGLTKEAVSGSRNENTVPNEGTVTYDIRFHVMTPQKNRMKILINVEAQKDYYPGYDLVTRAIFYCARMLSAQLDTEFSDSDYDEIKKVCSIWICMDSPNYVANTITRYAIQPEHLYGNFKGKARYDLLSAVMICLAKEGNEGNGSKLHGMLETLLSDTITAEDKLTALNRDYGIETSKKLKTEVWEMCNLSDRIEERTYEQVAIKMIRNGATDETIHDVTELTMERIAELRKGEE